jgi:hypothetical protein
MTILLYFAFVFFVLGSFQGFVIVPSQTPYPWYGRFNLVSAGLACWVGSLIFK